MRAGKVLKRSALIGAAVAILIGVVLYVQASRLPPRYRPAQLTAAQKKQAAKAFYSKIVNEFATDAQRNEPYDWRVSEEQLNAWLASMDEIASKTRTGKAGEVYKAMARADLAGPSVALRDGVMTLMVRSTKYEKIISVDIAFTFTPAKKLRVHVRGLRLGRLAMPDSLMRSRLDEFKRLSSSGGRDVDTVRSRAATAGISSDDVAAVLEAVLAAIDEEPISAELKINKKRVRIEQIEIAAGTLRMHVVPVGRKKVRR